MPELARIFDDKKYMWDGEIYDSEDVAKQKAKEYEKDGFETKVIEEEGKFLVYNRREIKT